VTGRGKFIFGVVGYGLVALAFLAFAAHVTQKVLSGGALDSYYSAKLIQWNYGSSFITLVLVLIAMLVVGAIKLVRWVKLRRVARESVRAKGP